jgi:hypothetical protein
VIETIEHRLAFALRVEDHFSGLAVGEELDVALDTGERAVTAAAGTLRHPDGTYRWSDLIDGTRRISIRSRSGQWMRAEPDPIEIDLPLAQPRHAVRIELWPTPLAAAPLGVPAIRGVLIGAAVAGLRVEIDGTATTTPTGRFTRADAAGELLFPLPGGPWPLTAAGDLDLTAVVPGRVVTSIEVVSEDTVFFTPQFAIPAARVSRVRFHVT